MHNILLKSFNKYNVVLKKYRPYRFSYVWWNARIIKFDKFLEIMDNAFGFGLLNLSAGAAILMPACLYLLKNQCLPGGFAKVE